MAWIKFQEKEKVRNVIDYTDISFPLKCEIL